MDKHKVIIVRYSVLLSKPTSFIIGRELDYGRYKEALFASKRLEIHEFLFLNVTLASLLEQLESGHKKNTTVFVLTSDQLPSKYLQTLEYLETKYSWFKLLKITGNEGISKKVKTNLNFAATTLVATIRLDDDDALSMDFLDKIDDYLIDTNNDTCISFSKGLSSKFCTQTLKYVATVETVTPKIALGLTYIDTYEPTSKQNFKTIFDLGNHNKIDQIKPLIINSDQVSFLRTLHQESDTKGQELSIGRRIENAEIADYIDDLFSIDSGLFLSN